MKLMSPTVRVLGIGNVLMGDDAVGPYAVRLLEALYCLPEEVSAEDVGTPGLDLTAFVEGLEAVVVVDSVRAGGGRPGELVRYDKKAVLEKPPGLTLSPHEPRLREALLAAEFDGEAPREVVLVGVVPERVEAGAGLSAVVQGALPGAVDAVVSELARLGVRPAPRDPPLVPDIWWAR